MVSSHRGGASGRRIAEKLVKAAFARTSKGRANFVIDAVFDEFLKNSTLDEVAHFVNEVGMGTRPVDTRMRTWSRKFVRYRMRRPTRAAPRSRHRKQITTQKRSPFRSIRP